MITLFIYDWRTTREYSTRDLAELTGISRTMINKYEQCGNEHIDIKKLELIAMALNCHITDLFNSQYK